MLRFTPIGIAVAALAVGFLALATFQGVTVATHVFDDVPNGAFFHDDAETIKKLNITTGCNPPTGNLYCPHNDVSRGEMASFLARLAKLSRATSSLVFVNTSTTPTHNTTIAGVTAPADGGLLVDLSFNCASASGSTNTNWAIDLLLDGGNASDDDFHIFFPHADLTTVPWANGSFTQFVPVTEGNHNIGYRAVRESGDGTLDCDIFTASEFIPFGNDGTTP